MKVCKTTADIVPSSEWWSESYYNFFGQRPGPGTSGYLALLRSDLGPSCTLPLLRNPTTTPKRTKWHSKNMQTSATPSNSAYCALFTVRASGRAARPLVKAVRRSSWSPEVFIDYESASVSQPATTGAAGLTGSLRPMPKSGPSEGPPESQCRPPVFSTFEH
jgi:hypothetical protein